MTEDFRLYNPSLVDIFHFTDMEADEFSDFKTTLTLRHHSENPIIKAIALGRAAEELSRTQYVLGLASLDVYGTPNLAPSLFIPQRLGFRRL